jgi:hypothetical protein
MWIEELKLLALAIYAVGFAAFTYFVGAALRSRGWLFLNNTFEDRPNVATSVQFLLSLGFYLTCLSLLLWNLGTEPYAGWVDGKYVFGIKELIQTVSGRLGVSIFVVSAFHTVNVLVLAVLSQKHRAQYSTESRPTRRSTRTRATTARAD